MKQGIYRFFGNYALRHFKYWAKNSAPVFKGALSKTLTALGCLTIGLAISLLLIFYSLWWLGVAFLALVLLVAVSNIVSFHSYCYLNAWELGGEGKPLDEILAIARGRFGEAEAKRLATSDRMMSKRRHSGRHPNKIRESSVDIILNVINLTALFAGIVIICFPLLNYFSLAFNDGAFNTQVVLFPVQPTLAALKYVLITTGAAEFWQAFANSTIITATVTIASNLMMALAAYSLSKRDFPFRGGILMYFVITMLFSSGIVPIYLMMSMLGLLNNILSVILISLSNVANMLYFKTFFEGISVDIEEAAKLDGASDLQLFFLIVIPMSLPIIGTCCFFTIVGTWNSYGSAMLFIDPGATKAQPLAYYLYIMLQSSTINRLDPWLQTNAQNVEAAAMLASIIPIILMYPYVVKYIKGGLQLGSVKG